MASCTFWDTITRRTPRPNRWRRESARSSPDLGSPIPTPTAAIKETMANTGTEGSPETKPGPLEAVLSALGFGRKAKAEAAAAAAAEDRPGSDLIDQAEAFQT